MDYSNHQFVTCKPLVCYLQTPSSRHSDSNSFDSTPSFSQNVLSKHYNYRQIILTFKRSSLRNRNTLT